MKKFVFGTLAVIALAGSASAEIETAAFRLAQTVNVATGQVSTQYGTLRQDRDLTTVLSAIPATSAGVNLASSQATASAPRFGDAYNAIAGGSLDQVSFPLFNSTSTASGTPTPITAGSVQVDFFNAVTFTTFAASTPIGSVSATFDFSGTNSLAPGFYGIYTIAGIGLTNNINLPAATPILMTFKWTLTGSTRHGFVSVPDTGVTVGSTTGTQFYMAGTPTPAEGFYNFSGTPTPQTNIAAQWVVPAPGAAALLALGGLAAARRRRN